MSQINIFALCVMLVITSACSSKQASVAVPAATELSTPADFVGTFVTSEYAHRDQGYDWTAVNIKALGSNQYAINIYSRADHKRQTCQYQGLAKMQDNHTLIAPLANTTVQMTLTLTNTTLSIWVDSDKPDDRFALMWYCSGGGSLAGEYQGLDDADN